MRLRLTGLILLMSVAGLAAASTAHAAFPGANGKIAFEYCGQNCEIYVMNADGTDQTNVTNNPEYDLAPAWSANGNKIAFVSRRDGNLEIYKMNEDGSGLTRLTNNSPNDVHPAWSPDGQKIAFTSYRDGQAEIYVMNADGTGQTNVTNNPVYDLDPSWSPDGSKIAFSSDRDVQTGGAEIYKMNSDGSGVTRLTNHPLGDSEPNWSPNGQKIAFAADVDYSDEIFSNIFVMNADGSGRTTVVGGGTPFDHPAWSPDGQKIVFTQADLSWIQVVNADGSEQTTIASVGSNPDWQPLPTAPYPHPQSASQLNVSLVPAFRQCGTGGNPSNAKHSPPLATNSCNPPRPGSVLALVGTTSQSSALMTVVPGDSDPTNGNQANVSLGAALSDIQSASGGDYNPNPSGADLTAVTRLRFTDKANGYGGLPATATEYDFKIPIDCSSTADPTIGSTCSANTTANALVPGLIQEQRQTVVQTFRVRVDDSGANGVRGDSDDRIFATQGVFVP
jgi:hypothetical protein